MKKIVDYQVIVTESNSRINERVQEAIFQGWEPFHGIAISVINPGEEVMGATIYAQAMVRYEEEEE